MAAGAVNPLLFYFPKEKYEKYAFLQAQGVRLLDKSTLIQYQKNKPFLDLMNKNLCCKQEKILFFI